MPTDTAPDHHVSRRRALGAGAAASAGLLLALGRAPAGAAEACATLTPEKTIGPYFVEEGLDRSDIRTDPATGAASPGSRLTLALTLLDESTAACAPLAGAQVDIWHADANGKYSDEASEGTSGRKELRGNQTSDAAGRVTFVTIHPGWYSGRAVHIHVRIRRFDATGAATYDFLTQLFFADAYSDAIFAQAPYSARGARDTRDSDDGIYGSDGASLLLAPTADADGAGHTASFTFGLPATADGDTGGAGGGGAPPTGGPGQAPPAATTATTATTPATAATPAATTPTTASTPAATTTTPGTTTSASGASTATSDTTVQAALRGAAFVRTALGTRVLVVRLRTEEAVGVDLRLLRGSTRLKRRRAVRVAAGSTRLRIPLAAGVAAGRATLQLTVTDAAGNRRVLSRVLHVPARGA